MVKIIFKLLYAAIPAAVPTSKIIQEAYGYDRGPRSPNTVITVQLSKHRARLAAGGWKIITKGWGGAGNIAGSDRRLVRI